jgi:hypothetical protein
MQVSAHAVINVWGAAGASIAAAAQHAHNRRRGYTCSRQQAASDNTFPFQQGQHCTQCCLYEPAHAIQLVIQSVHGATPASPLAQPASHPAILPSSTPPQPTILLHTYTDKLTPSVLPLAPSLHSPCLPLHSTQLDNTGNYVAYIRPDSSGVQNVFALKLPDRPQLAAMDHSSALLDLLAGKAERQVGG